MIADLDSDPVKEGEDKTEAGSTWLSLSGLITR
jgi:hypothetical protein